MNLERMRHAGRQMKLALALPCCFASLVTSGSALPARKVIRGLYDFKPESESESGVVSAVGDFNGDWQE